VVIALILLAGGMGIWWFSPAHQRQLRIDDLFAACKAGDLKAVQNALTGGAGANSKDSNGITALMVAARGNRPNMSRPEDTDHPDVAQLLITNGADVNATTDTGFVALFWAARYGHAKVVKVLIEKGADSNAKDKDGMTALKWATTNQSASPSHYEKVIGYLHEPERKE